MLADRRQAAVYFVARVLAVVNPNPQPFVRLLAQQIAARRHRDRLDHVEAGLAHSARAGGQRNGAALVVLAVQPRARRQLCNVERHERAQLEHAAASGRLLRLGALLRLRAAVGAGRAFRAVRAQVKTVPIVAETGTAAVLERRNPTLVKFARQPLGNCARCGIVVFKQNIVVAGQDARNNDPDLYFARPVQPRADALHCFINNKLQHVVGVLALAQQARDNANLHGVDVAVRHCRQLGLDVNRPALGVAAGGVGGAIVTIGCLCLARQQRLGQEFVKLLQFGEIQRPAAIPQLAAFAALAVLCVVRADAADKRGRVHRRRIGRQFFRQTFPDGNDAVIFRRLARRRVFYFYADVKVAAAAVAHPNKAHRQLLQPRDNVVAAGVDVLQVEIKINKPQFGDRLEVAVPGARHERIDAFVNAAPRPVLGFDKPLDQRRVVGEKLFRALRVRLD